MSTANSPSKIAIGADHGGFELKQSVRSALQDRGHDVFDCGTHSTESVDYPDIAHAVAKRVSTGQSQLGIIIDRAGIGSAMAANKWPGVRAALCYDLSSARNSREHNNANMLTLGAGLIGPDLALQIVETWLSSSCTVQRHLRRAAMIDLNSADKATGASNSSHVCTCHQEETMPNMMDADIERVIRRVVERFGESGSGDSPSLACTFCQTCAETNPDFVRQLVGMGADRVGHSPGAGSVPGELGKYIDHTLLKPDATRQDIVELCAEAKTYQFASVCVHPANVRLVAEQLRGSPVKVCSVVGFPHGANVSEVKALEARRAIRDGAKEIDMVINVGALKSGDDDLVYRDIRAVTDVCMDGRALCKVILETTLLTDEEKIRACKCAKKARANFVKTSTGFAGGGATAHDVALMASSVSGTKMGVKASGGIRSFEDAKAMIQAGATRLGASAGVRILDEAKGLIVPKGTSSERY
jgi:deoxyribose-phosphate aldolase